MAGHHERRQDCRVFGRGFDVDLVQRPKGRHLVGLVPATTGAPSLVGADEVEFLAGERPFRERRSRGHSSGKDAVVRQGSRMYLEHSGAAETVLPGLQRLPQ